MITVTLSAADKNLTLNPMSISIPSPGISETLQAVEQSCSFDAAYDPGLLALTALEDIKAVVKDGENTLFTGVITTDMSFSDSGYPTPVERISLSIKDNSYLLRHKTAEPIAIRGKLLQDVVDRICDDCGVTVAEGSFFPAETVDFFVLEKDKVYSDALNALLFEHLTAFTFNALGELMTVDLSAIPEVGSTLEILDGSGIFTGLQVMRTTKAYTAAKVSYNPIVAKTDEQIYFEGNGLNADNKIQPIILQPNQYYPYTADPIQEAREGQVFQTFSNGYAEVVAKYNGETSYERSQKTTLLYSENHKLVPDWAGSITVDRTNFSPTQASVRLFNTSATDTADLYQLSIRADAWYRSGDASVTKGSGDQPYSYAAQFIYSSSRAERLAELCSRFFCGTGFKINGNFGCPLVAGTVYKIDTGTSGFTVSAVVISCSYNPETEMYSAVLLSYGAALVDTTRFVETVASGTGLDAAIGAVGDKVDGIINGSAEDIDAPGTPQHVSAVASVGGVQIVWDGPADGLANTIKSILIGISRDDGNKWQIIRTDGTRYFYEFNRLVDGYPEIPDLASWRIRVKAVNVYGKESEYSVSTLPDVSQYKTWRVAAVTPKAAASRDSVAISYTDRNQGAYGTIVHDIYINGTLKTTTGSTGYVYIFNRAVDGYPEPSELAGYNIKIVTRNEASEASATVSAVNFDLSGYKTWLVPPVALVAVDASRDGIAIAWRLDDDLTFGDVRYTLNVKYDGVTVKSKSGIVGQNDTYVFNRNFDKDGYPETPDRIAALEQAGLPLRGRDVSKYTAQITAYTAQKPVTTAADSTACTYSSYGTWIAPDIESISPAASRDAVTVTVSIRTAPSQYGAPYTYIFERSKNGITWETVQYSGASYAWPFNRITDGYPDRADLTTWRYRTKAVSTAGNQSVNWGGTFAGTPPLLDKYGTWKLQPPKIQKTVNNRAITLTMMQPAAAGALEVYGTIKHLIQIQKPPADSGWFKPAESLDPYADEDNYKEGGGSITAEAVYTQTMPLTGQTVVQEIIDGKEVNRSSPESTLYRFKVVAYNEAGESEASEVNATALANGIQDVVAGSITHDKISTPSLSAISGNMGVISSGAMAGSILNYWYLSSIIGQMDIEDRYEGAMRVGGKDEYLLVDPIVENGRIVSYRIYFRVGNFEVNSELSRINGELIVMQSAGSLDRTRITPTGTYYEHRETPDSERWNVITHMRTDGIKAQSVYSDKSLVLTNTSIQDRRRTGYDIGRPYLSAASRVWHFDTDLKDQKQAEGLVIAAAGEVSLVDQYTTGVSIDFTPAILAVAPFSEIGKSAYGLFAALFDAGQTNCATVDFWIQYIWCENQVLFDIGNEIDRVKLVIANDEPYFNGFVAEHDTVPFNQEILESGDVIVFNEPAAASSTIQHYGSTVPVPPPEQIKTFAELGIEFGANTWLHIGAVLNADTIEVYINKVRVVFNRYSAGQSNVSIRLNQGQQTFVMDELMIDPTAAESFDDFVHNTGARIPWGALDQAHKHFILSADNFLTNIFDTDLFRRKVLEIING